ncbi:hypothetical protein I4U23_027401 [Adineta vaga]|nr:hypothetical protein I4U23_027401 [Adineta vaga]
MKVQCFLIVMIAMAFLFGSLVDARSAEFMKRSIADEHVDGAGKDLTSFKQALMESSKVRRKRDCQADIAACYDRCDYPCLWIGCTAAGLGCQLGCQSAYHC